MKDKLFFDTNVMLDLLGERIPFYQHAAKIATLADLNKIQLVASALSYPTVFYILSKYEAKDAVKEKIRKFRVIAETVELTDKIIAKGL